MSGETHKQIREVSHKGKASRKFTWQLQNFDWPRYGAEAVTRGVL